MHMHGMVTIDTTVFEIGYTPINYWLAFANILFFGGKKTFDVSKQKIDKKYKKYKQLLYTTKIK